MTAEVYGWGTDKVLKLFYPSISKQWCEYEAKLGRTVHEAGVLSPSVYGVVEVEGRIGILFERIEGISMFRLIESKPWHAVRYARRMAQLHEHMHRSNDGETLPSQKKVIAEAIRHSRDVLGERTEEICYYLAGLPDGNSICHGDFHPDNILIGTDADTVIDWTNAYAGNPLGDAARTCIMLESPFIRPGTPALLLPAAKVIKRLLARSYRDAYLQLSRTGSAQLESWMLPVAAARLRENLPGEREWLLRLIDRKLSELRRS